MDEVPVSKLVFLSVLSFILGILVSPYFRGFFFLVIIFVALLKPKKILLLLFFIFGVFYYQFTLPADFLLPLYEGETVTLQGKVVEEERDVIEVVVDNESLDERIIVYDQASLSYGKLVEIKGEPNVPSDEYLEYFQRDNISVQFFDPEIRVVGEAISTRALIYKARRSLASRINRGTSFPESEILKAILLGYDSTPEEVRGKFSKIGIAHLLAVSGTHIVVISGIILSIFTFLNLKYKTFLSVIVLWLFIALVGAPVSAIRAGFLGSFLIASKKAGRRGSSLRGITFIGFILLLFDPQLIRDVGFQLSFSASAGIIIFSDRVKSFLIPQKNNYITDLSDFKNKLTKKINKTPDFIIDTISITLSAQITTLPLVFYHFGNLPFLAPLSNLIIAPFLPFIMISGILGIVFSIFIPETLAFFIPNLIVQVVLFLADLFYTVNFL